MSVNNIDIGINNIDINKDFSNYQIINIYSECMKKTNYPCYHNVNIKINDNNDNNNNERIVNNCLLSSETIAEYYKFYNVNIPFHFSNHGFMN